MAAIEIAPSKASKVEAFATLAGFGLRPFSSLRALHEKHGPFVILPYPLSLSSKPKYLACVASTDLYREAFSNTHVWRPVNVGFRGLRGQATSRLSVSMTRLRGAQHAHYRRLMTPPLGKSAVLGASSAMYAIAARHVSDWPRETQVDFAALGGKLAQELAITLLFGDDSERAAPVIAMINDAVDAAWPLPGPAHLRWARTAPKLERAIHEWADVKRGADSSGDLFSALVNNPDHRGNEADLDVISGLLVFTLGAAYETCQNALAWTMALLAQHPGVAERLSRDVETAFAGETPDGEALDALPYLDWVTKEGMRLFSPVSIQFRRSMSPTTLGGAPIDEGIRILVSAFLINRDPKLYADPQRFLPERWDRLKATPYEYTVFGAGARMCPGFAFGIQMVKAALAAIVATHRFEVPAGSRIDHRATITVAPHPGIPMIFHNRSANPQTHHIAGTINELVDLPNVN
ncbi:cytochrome P450 [Oricola sp.]|uniref:cytochrome P450 n=1 Tax=Oricola sp. TaxID=1979950 RepID=UPI003BA9307E